MTKVLRVLIAAAFVMAVAPVNLMAAFADQAGAGSSVAGTVKDASGKPMANVKVVLLEQGNPPKQVAAGTTNGAGQFSLAVKPGHYILQVLDSTGHVVAALCPTVNADNPVTAVALTEGNVPTCAAEGGFLEGTGTVVLSVAAVAAMVAAVGLVKANASPTF